VLTRDLLETAISKGLRHHELPGNLNAIVAIGRTFPTLKGFSIEAREGSCWGDQHQSNRDEGRERKLHCRRGSSVTGEGKRRELEGGMGDGL
jgi:hypothetical protein